MKHGHDWLRKEFSKIRDEITRNYVLNTLTKSDEELQQLNTCDIEELPSTVRSDPKGNRYIKIPEILGDGATAPEGENQT